MKLNTLNIKTALQGLKSKTFTSKELTQECFDQIKKYNSELNIFLTVVSDEALKQAAHCDHLIETLGDEAFKEYPLLGIPYACKDNFNTLGIKTTASSNVLKNYISPYESTVTQLLKDAGAILLGKTNMDAFAHGSSTETSDFNASLNPWDTSRVAGGSSGGSAAAVIANMCIFAIGSETSGSIRGPASWCSVSGLKPTYGRVSRYGVIAMASSTDSPGPLCKTIEDCAYVIDVIAGHDANDATSSLHPPNDYRALLSTTNLKGKKIGIPKSFYSAGIDSSVEKITLEAIKNLESLGAQIVDIDLLDPKYSIAVYTILQRSEVSSNLARFDGIRFGDPRSSFGFEAKKRMLLGAFALSSGYYDQYYSKAQKVRTLIINDFNNAFEKVDFIAGPTMPTIALKVGQSADQPMFGEKMDILASPSSIAGLPAISVPCGFSENMPVGLQIIGPMFNEADILSAGYNYQQVSNYHLKVPQKYD